MRGSEMTRPKSFAQVYSALFTDIMVHWLLQHRVDSLIE